jgi:hypothetical protein
VEKYEGDTNGEMTGTKTMHTSHLPEVDVVSPATASAANSAGDCAQATDGGSLNQILPNYH